MDDAAHFQELFTRVDGRPDLYPYQLDLERGLALLVEMDARAYRDAAFLDARMLGPEARGGWVPLAELDARVMAGPAAKPVNFIFHVGHCGSTLISRLLGELAGCFALREPLPLLELAALHRRLAAPDDIERWQRLLELMLRLLARTPAPDQTALVKATSSCANLAPALLAREPGGRALLLHVSLETYLATMLRAPATREGAREQGVQWLQDFAALTGRAPEPLGDAQQIALNWALAMHGMMRAAQAAPERVRWLDFDVFLAAPAATLNQLAQHMELAAAMSMIEDLVSGPLMNRYAKDEGQAFDAAARGVEIDTARERFAGEIEAGLAWFEEQAARYPEFAALRGLAVGE